jgi:thioredoxin reductase
VAFTVSRAAPLTPRASIIIATGASAKRLFLPGEDTYWQSGI